MEEENRRMRAKNRLVRVTFPSGKVICHKSTTSTMIAVLNEIGEDVFPLIKLELCHMPLLSREIYPKYREYMKPVCEGWFLNTQSNSDAKFLQLKAINSQLKLGLKIELGTDFETQDEPEKQKRAKSKDKLLVKMPNGEYIANNSALTTFLEAVWRLGIEGIMKKDLSWCGNPLITSRKIANKQVQVDKDKWMFVPNMTKDKVKLLRVIGAVMHVRMEVNAI